MSLPRATAVPVHASAPTGSEDLVAAGAAIAAWARMTYGWMGRSPDYKASFLATLGGNADLYAPYADNARRWYREAQERVAPPTPLRRARTRCYKRGESRSGGRHA